MFLNKSKAKGQFQEFRKLILGNIETNVLKQKEVFI